jgi:hypothetical protein
VACAGQRYPLIEVIPEGMRYRRNTGHGRCHRLHGRPQGLRARQLPEGAALLIAIEQLLLGQLQRVIELAVIRQPAHLGALLGLEPLLR